MGRAHPQGAIISRDTFYHFIASSITFQERNGLELWYLVCLHPTIQEQNGIGDRQCSRLFCLLEDDSMAEWMPAFKTVPLLMKQMKS